MPSKFQFWYNFDWFSEGKWRHVGTRIESKTDVNFERPILQKVLKNQWDFSDFSFVFPYFLQNRPFEVETDFGSDLGANLPPFSFPKSIKIRFWMASKNYAIWASIFMPFWDQLGPILGFNLDPSWFPGAPQIASQDAFGSQNPPRPPKWLQNGAPDPPKWGPRPPILDRFWC